MMRLLIGIVPLFIVVVWDLSANHGNWLRAATGAVDGMLRQIGL
jgi:hypothetical protein